MRLRWAVHAVVVTLLVAACGGAAPAPDPTTPRAVTTFGEELFNERVIGVNPGCITCHSLQEGIVLVGPSLATIMSPIAGVSDADYIRDSILNPDGYLAEGYSAGQMSSGWDEYLTEAQIDSLVDYLLQQP